MGDGGLHLALIHCEEYPVKVFGSRSEAVQHSGKLLDERPDKVREGTYEIRSIAGLEFILVSGHH